MSRCEVQNAFDNLESTIERALPAPASKTAMIGFKQYVWYRWISPPER
jgi:hypothetical protein